MVYSRRDIGKLALASLALPRLFETYLSAAGNSRINGVQIGAITYSFRSMPDPKDIIAAMKNIGLFEVELMSGDAEKLAGIPPLPTFGRGGRGPGRGRAGAPAPGAAASAAAPSPAGAPAAGAAPVDGATGPGAPAGPGGPGVPAGGRRGGFARGPQLTPEQMAERDAATAAQNTWRMSATAATFKPAVQACKDAGIEIRLLCYNMNVNSTKDDEIEYAFMMAKALGAKAMSTSTQVSMAKRVAPFADKHKMMVGFHGHDQTDRPDEVASEETFKTVMAASKYLGANLDIGHYTAANGDPVAFIKQYHDRITNLHLKDRKKNHGPNVPWGEGDTPIKDVLQLLKANRGWDIPANIEFEYQGDPLVEVPKCLLFIKAALA
jgi:sugar phosphate isomerase/epimerase